ncbi:asparagine synthase (glutamine-hydrolyzing) [Candidatus Pelagibacter sp.]|nr:asparagine synthase (glutamine-hydrolyzing) [Candidatus Pelagibacter sp.]
MCGFIGNFGCSKNHFKKQLKNVVHRGPDHESLNYNINWNIEFYRLSINDLSTNGNQPFKVGKISAFVNGEIYNSSKLKEEYFPNKTFISNSDAEIVPHMYEKFGIEFIKYLDGMFSIVIIDDKENKLYLIKDSFGKKPLYYMKKNDCDCINFASENRIIDDKNEINNKNIQSLLFLQYRFFDQTIYQDIKSIPPGSYLEYQNNKLKIIKWYSPKITKIDKEDIEKKFLYLFEKSIKKRLMSDVQMGVFLSGGVDSNLVARMLYNTTGRKIITFSAIIKNKDNLEGNDTDTLDKIKSALHGIESENFFINVDFEYLNNNLVKIISAADQPIIDSGYIVQYACAEKAKELNIKVILTGIGADECFGGYNWQARYKDNNKLINWAICKISKLDKFFLNSKNKYLNYLFFPYFMHNSSFGQQYWKDINLNFLKTTKRTTYESITNYTNFNKDFIKKDFKNFLDYINIYGILNHTVTYSDLACMLNSIENRSPFLDKEFFEFCMSIPSKYKNQNKTLLKLISKNIVPDEVLNRPKTGPTINYSVFFENKEILDNSKKFIFKNIYIIEDYISETLSKKIQRSFNLLCSEGYLPLMSIIKIIIWIKYNIEKSIDKNITFIKLIENNKD